VILGRTCRQVTTYGPARGAVASSSTERDIAMEVVLVDSSDLVETRPPADGSGQEWPVVIQPGMDIVGSEPSKDWTAGTQRIEGGESGTSTRGFIAPACETSQLQNSFFRPHSLWLEPPL